MTLKVLFTLFVCAFPVLSSMGQKATVTWQLSDTENLSTATITCDTHNVLTSSYLAGNAIAKVAVMTAGNAETGYQTPTYDPAFCMYYVTTKQTGKTGGHNIAFGVKPATGHTFKPTKISFDAAKCGTNYGNFDVYLKTTSSSEKALATTQVPLRNQAKEGNINGYSHHEYTVSDYLVDGENFLLFIYIYNINGVDTETPKAIAFRNITIEGVVDEPIYNADHYISNATFKTKAGETRNFTNLIAHLKNGEQAMYDELLKGDPTDFEITAIEGYSVETSYNNKLATFTIKDKDGESVFTLCLLFKVTYREEKPAATPLKRGLMSINLSQSGSSGNLVSWRYRERDNNQVKFKLWRGTNATAQNTKVNSGNYIYNRTNFRDTGGSSTSYYRLEVYDLNDNLIETEVSGKTWANQSMEIPTSAPTDTRGLGATYTPNDAAFYDMDGDGEYEIVLKWDPSNSRDAASNGVTSDTYIDCYKLDGTKLWRINIGPNICSGAHTTPFLVWDFDGDGYGELVCKTAPGTVDGEGNYVTMGNDDPTKSWLNGRGKPDAGPEYVTVFDGLTGAELATTEYHTKYGDVNTSFWGDEKQNRSERYIACVAYLDGKTPCAVMCRGYYSGASLGAYTWDGSELKPYWIHRSSTSGKELWGEGAHFCLSGDVDDDGKDEIVYGSACLDDDGKTIVHRTGLGHGDALHLGDFDWDNDGLEIFMPHEKSPYGFELRDAKSGKLLVHQTAGGDTGRGLAANFDSSNEGAELMASCTSALMDCKGNTIAQSWAIGSSGASINNRIYWDGDPYDEFFDKSVLAHWNASARSFDRIQVNGSNYTPGTLNNYSKYNPCVMGDMLGDWREEIVTWNSENMALIITATNFESNYRLPHLMDNRQYAEGIANQNVGYNQPPHLSYDPARQYSLHATLPASGWVSLYTEYALQVPSDVMVYYVNNVNTNVDTLKLAQIKGTIPAQTGFLIKGKPNSEICLRPASVSVSRPSVNKLFGDGILPASVESNSTTSYYQWEEREGIGTGYFRVTTATIPTGVAYLKLTSSSAREKEYFLIGETAVGIKGVSAVPETEEATYTLDGKIAQPQQKGIVVSKGKKYIK